MSRIGRQPVNIPEKVKVVIQGDTVKIEGPKGRTEHKVSSDFTCTMENNQLTIVPNKGVEKNNRFSSFYGMERAILNNKIRGVVEEYVKILRLEGIGYRSQLVGNTLNFTLGFSHPLSYVLPSGIVAVVENQTKITITGINKELVGMVASKIKSLKKPEPYQGKGIRYEGERIRRKAGKSAAGAKATK